MSEKIWTADELDRQLETEWEEGQKTFVDNKGKLILAEWLGRLISTRALIVIARNLERICETVDAAERQRRT